MKMEVRMVTAETGMHSPLTYCTDGALSTSPTLITANQQLPSGKLFLYRG